MGFIILKKKIIIGLLATFMLSLPTNTYSAVLINEILANGVDDPDSEWVEMFNNESVDVNLTNWKISETSSSNFTLNAAIPANSFVILANDFAAFNSAYPNVHSSGIKIIDITISNFNLADTSGEVKLYNSSGALVDSTAYAQASGKKFENVSIGRYPDGNSNVFNLTTLTPGAKNDKLAPILNKWINPSSNNTKVSALLNITINITDDTTQVNSSISNFNGTNFSMSKLGDMWTFLWNTSLNLQKPYNITVFFNDSYGKSGSDTLFNIIVNNSPFIASFSPLNNITQMLAENSTLSFNVNASDPDDALLNFSWFIDNLLNSTNPVNFTYSPGFNDNGTHVINATIKDSSLNQVSIKWTVRVTNLNRAPILDEISNKTISKNFNLTFNITASDFDNDALAFSSNKSAIAFSKISNSLATVSWTPTNLDLGSNVINFTVSDGSAADSKVSVIVVNFTINNAPEITSSPKTTAVKGERYAYDVEAADPDNDILGFSLKTNVSGMSIDASTGLIAFTPSSIGFFTVNISVTDLIETANQSYNLSVERGSPLKITDVDVEIDGKKSSNVKDGAKIRRAAKPSSDIKLDITVKNDFLKSESIKIENIEAKAAIEGIGNGEGLEEESKEFDLRAESDKTVTLKFKLPLNVDEDDFDVLIEAEGEDENGNIYEDDFEFGLEVEKEKHDLRFLGFELSPAVISCSRIVSGRFNLINIGQEDEENAVLEIKNGNLGLDFAQKVISINEGTEGNTLTKSISIKLNDEIENGDYSLVANLYTDDNKLSDTKIAEIKVADCIKISESRDEVILITGSAVQGETQAIKQPLQMQAGKITGESDRSMQLLLLSSFVFTMFFMLTAIVLYLRF